MPPTVKRGMISTQSDTTNIKLDVSEVIDQLSPDDTPFMALVGRDSLSNPCTQLLHEWLEDELRPRSGTLGAAYTAGSGQLTLGSGQGKYLYPDDLLLVGDNVIRVVSGPPDSDTLTVVGGVGASTDASAANAATWRKLGHAAQEGGSARTDPSKTVLNKPYNYTQIFKDWVQVTGTMEVIDRYGYASERAYQEEKVIKQLAIDFEHVALYGVRETANNGGTRKSSMGGLFDYVYLAGVANAWDTVVSAAGANLTETLLNNVLQKIWELGGQPDCIMVNGTNKRRITNWSTPRIRETQGSIRGGGTVSVYESDFGSLEIYKNRWLRPADVLILTKANIGMGPLVGRQMSSRMLPTTFDGTWYEILGEYTMEVHKPQQAFGWIYNTSTTY